MQFSKEEISWIRQGLLDWPFERCSLLTKNHGVEDKPGSRRLPLAVGLDPGKRKAEFCG